MPHHPRNPVSRHVLQRRSGEMPPEHGSELYVLSSWCTGIGPSHRYHYAVRLTGEAREVAIDAASVGVSSPVLGDDVPAWLRTAAVTARRDRRDSDAAALDAMAVRAEARVAAAGPEHFAGRRAGWASTQTRLDTANAAQGLAWVEGRGWQSLARV